MREETRLGVAFASVLLSSHAAGDAPFGVLVDADGAAETYGVCIACHSEKIIAQQGLSRAAWDELLDWMVEEHGMANIQGPVRDRILDYLAQHYGEDRPNYSPD
ncbi:MAG: aldehyde dehydrogenase [Gammaproteobacteria bacterium]|nr:aldehyde dehydrogenase [Gammaproteobacteria bacterium]